MNDASSFTKMSRVHRRALLKSQYFHMTRADALDAALAEAVEDFDAGNLTGRHFEATGLVVIGESGSGKTTEINEALRRFSADPRPLECGLERKFVQLALEAETTWKALGIQLLKNLGFELTARRTEHEIWARVRSQLEGQGIWLLHIDECQHMFQTLGTNEILKVLNALKTFMKHREWPMVIILSGIPELLTKVNIDPQFQRLVTPVHMAQIDPMSSDLEEIDTAFYGLATKVGIDIGKVRTEDTYMRLSYACLDVYGRVFRFLVDLLAALPEGRTELTLDDFAERYAVQTGCMPGQNVFLREDYRECSAGLLMPEA